MSAHTEGPWSVEPVEYGDVVTDDLCIIGPSPDFRIVASVVRCYQGDRIKEMELANARVLAAAPDLLALAREMEAFSEAAMKDAIEAGAANMGLPSEHKLDIITWTERMNHCRAAIAKATGDAA